MLHDPWAMSSNTPIDVNFNNSTTNPERDKAQAM